MQKPLDSLEAKIEFDRLAECEAVGSVSIQSETPVEKIEIGNPEVERLGEDKYKVISQKVSYRLAQRPGVYVILKYIRNVIKKHSPKENEKKISSAPTERVRVNVTRYFASMSISGFSDEKTPCRMFYLVHAWWEAELSAKKIDRLDCIWKIYRGRKGIVCCSYNM